ncbi:MAG: 2-C-methyl-D-erythritol 4-phosphate cytidylyltransferase [Gemmatimonadales bacterium]|nr:2-C-methyl-D-erythritol 4-phosphate cytidylyltransferase [Gemmatimonadales bacterium]
MSRIVPLHLILLAGGTGRRAGGSGPGQRPKQFHPTGRGPLFAVSVREFLNLDPTTGFRLAGVTIAVPDSWQEEATLGLAPVMRANRSCPWQLASAGETRTGSTWQAIQTLERGYSAGQDGSPPEAYDLVAVHDAARPFASVDLLGRLAAAAGSGADSAKTSAGCAVPGIPVPDTIVQKSSPDFVPSPGGRDSDSFALYLPRETLLAVQTPQVFRWDIFRAAHAVAAAEGLDFTDDGGLLASRGHNPVMVPGETGNWKVTSEADLQRAEELLK